MNYTKASCGHHVIAVGAPGSPARIKCESEPCEKCGPTYRTFLRSARNFAEFSASPKKTVDTGLTYSEAREACQEYNASLTAREEELGTKLEFEAED